MTPNKPCILYSILWCTCPACVLPDTDKDARQSYVANVTQLLHFSMGVEHVSTMKSKHGRRVLLLTKAICGLSSDEVICPRTATIFRRRVALDQALLSMRSACRLSIATSTTTTNTTTTPNTIGLEYYYWNTKNYWI